MFSFKTIIISYRILWRMNFSFRQDINLNNVTYFTCYSEYFVHKWLHLRSPPRLTKVSTSHYCRRNFFVWHFYSYIKQIHIVMCKFLLAYGYVIISGVRTFSLNEIISKCVNNENGWGIFFYSKLTLMRSWNDVATVYTE